MQLETFSPPDGGQERKALKFGSQKIDLHDAKAPYVPHAKNSIQVAIDLCFITDTPPRLDRKTRVVQNPDRKWASRKNRGNWPDYVSVYPRS